MKKYFTGFFTAMCLTGSLFILMGSRSQFHQDIIANSIIVPNSDGSMTILDGNGITTYNDEGKVVSTLGKKNDEQGHLLLSNTDGNTMCYLGSGSYGGTLLTYNIRGKETSQLMAGIGGLPREKIQGHFLAHIQWISIIPAANSI